MRTVVGIAGVVLAAALVATLLLAPVPEPWARRMRLRAVRLRRSIRARVRQRRPLVLACLVVAAIAAIVLTVWVLPTVLTEHPRIADAADRHKAITDTRTGLVAVLAALGAAGGLAYTARTYTLSRAGQITDRYSTAVGHLGSEKIEVRLGGIYALERLMRDSPDDQPTIMETLAAYVRQHSPLDSPPTARRGAPPTAPDAAGRDFLTSATTPAADVQAVLTVLGRRHLRDDERPIDLREVNLAGAYLEDANLAGARLSGTDLSGAILYKAHLADAWLDGADLTGASLWNADLARADLGAANLTDAFVDGANLAGADLSSADLTAASLTGTDVTGADLDYATVTRGALTDAQLDSGRRTDTIMWVSGHQPST